MSCNCITVITVNDIESAPGFGGKLHLAFFELIKNIFCFFLSLNKKAPLFSRSFRRQKGGIFLSLDLGEVGG